METQTGDRFRCEDVDRCRLVWLECGLMPVEKHVCNVLCDLLGAWKHIDWKRYEKIMFKRWAMIACCSPLQKISSSSSSTTLAKTGAEQCNHFHQSSNIKHEKTRLCTILHHYTHPSLSQPPWNGTSHQSSLLLAVKGIAGCSSRKMRPLLLSGAKWSLRRASKIERDRTVDSLHPKWHGNWQLHNMTQHH